MSEFDTIKSYLVGLGFQIDNPSYSKMKQTLTELSRTVESVTTGMTKQFVRSSTVIVGALASVTAATTGLLDKVAQLDLGYQKFAMRMYMGTQAAKQFKIATDALGESLEDISWNPELRERYKKLMNLSAGMNTPDDAGAQLKYIRDIRFEFTRLKVEATYGMQWVGYYLIKFLGGPLGSVKGTLEKMNDWLTVNMPRWTSKIAEFLAWGTELFINLLRPIKLAATGLSELWELMGPTGRAVVLSLGIVLASVFAPFTTAVIGAILLFDDFMAYLDGRKSNNVLAPIWQATIDALNIVEKIIFKIGVTIDMMRQGKWHEISKSVDRMFFGKKDYNKNEIDDAMELFKGIDANKPEGLKGTGTPAPLGYNAPGGLAGIARAETGGIANPYTAKNPGSTAYGKYQILKGSWNDWAPESGLGKNAPMTPENQEIVANFKYSQYLKKYNGNQQLAAVAWNQGPGVADQFVRGDYSRLADVNSYVQKATGSAFNVGGITVNVAQTNASPQEIAKATASAVQEQMRQNEKLYGHKTALSNREFAGVRG